MEGVLRDAGFEVEVQATVPPQGEGAYWLILLAIGPAAFLRAFFDEAGKDAWHRLRGVLDDLKAARDKPDVGPGDIIVRPDQAAAGDPGSTEEVAVLLGWIGPRDDATVLHLSADLPDAALEALFELDLTDHDAAHLVWDEKKGKWRTV